MGGWRKFFRGLNEARQGGGAKGGTLARGGAEGRRGESQQQAIEAGSVGKEKEMDSKDSTKS